MPSSTARWAPPPTPRLSWACSRRRCISGAIASEQIIAENPTWSEEQVTWQLIEEMAVKGSELLLPVFERERGLKGRISIQTNPTFYRDAERIVAQAMRFHALAPNMQVKIPVTAAGIPAIEEATYRGVNVNATVSSACRRRSRSARRSSAG